MNHCHNATRQAGPPAVNATTKRTGLYALKGTSSLKAKSRANLI